MPKVFLNYDQQIEKLKKEKNLLIEDEIYKSFIKELKSLIEKYLKKHDSISEQELYERMGFPENWKKITRYRKQ